MCHEKYHHDADLRAVANFMTGLATARSSATRERSSIASAMLLNTACCEGLLAFVEENTLALSTGERHRLLTKLRSVRARMAQDAMSKLANWYPEDEPPF